MEKVIYKYELYTSDMIISMPKGATILTAQIDNKTKTPTIWALVNPEAEMEEVRFIIVMTGIPLLADLFDKSTYINTYQHDWFVGHVFKVNK